MLKIKLQRLFQFQELLQNRQVRQMSCERCAQLQKKIRVMLSDHEFELRKLREDKADQISLFQISMQKELRKWQQRYNREKMGHQQNNKKWLSKVDQITASYQLQFQQLKQLYETHFETEKRSLKDAFDLNIQQLRQNYHSAINTMQSKHEQELQLSQNNHKKQIQALKQTYSNQIEQLKKQAQQKQESMRKDLQSKIFALQAEKKAQQSQHAKLQQDYTRERSKLLGEIYDSKATANLLDQSLKLLKTNLVQKEQQIERNIERSKEEIKLLNEQICNQKKVSQNSISKIRRQWDELIQHQKQLSLQRELQIMNQYEEAVKIIDQKRQNEQKIYSSNLTEVRAFIQNRPSKEQDIEQILVIRQKLSKKERQYQSLQRQVKSYQLELQNKEDTYNRLFLPNVSPSHLHDSHFSKRKELRVKRPGKSLSSVRDILIAANQNNSHLPSLSIDKKMPPPKSTKVL